MADNCVFNRESGEIGDDIIINGIAAKVQNSYKLVTNPTTNERYYEMKLLTNANVFIIDEASITKVLLIKIGDTIYNKKWTYCNNTVLSRITNEKGLYLGKYLINYLEGDNIIYHNNENKFDFRMNNMVLKTRSELNCLAKRVRKPSVLKPPTDFFKDEPKELLNQNNQEYNSYVVLKIISTKEEYIKIHIKNDYYTIISPESLNDVVKFNWYMSGDYVSAKVYSSCDDPKILALYNKGDSVYLHRYLIQLQGIEIPEDQSIDHINHDKLDNRLVNLRVATQSEQNRNRPNVARSVEIPEDINQENILDKADIPQCISLAKPKDGHSPFFNIEITYPHANRIRAKSTSKNTINLIQKLCDAIHKRYLLIIKNNLNIQILMIDGIRFNTNEEFLAHTNSLIKKFMLKINKTDIIDIDTLIPYIAKLEYGQSKVINKKKPKADANAGTHLVDALVEEVQPEAQAQPAEAQAQPHPEVQAKPKAKKVCNKVAVVAPRNGIVYKTPLTLEDIHLVYDKVKPHFINYCNEASRAPRFDGDFTYNLNPRKKISFGGLSDIGLTLNEKLAWTILRRFAAFVIHENNTNDLIYKDGAVPPNQGKNVNTTGYRTLSDVTFNECNLFEKDKPPTPNKFDSFDKFRDYTETYISNVLSQPATLETYVLYIKNKVPRLTLPVLTLKYPNAPMLTV